MRKAHTVAFRHLAGKQQLMAVTQRGIQLGEGLDQTGQVLAFVSTAGVQHKWPIEPELGLQRPGFVGADVARLEVIVDSGRHIDHSLCRHTKVFQGFLPCKAGNRQQATCALQVAHLTHVVLLVIRIRL
ncbi:hypothetical protein D3C80_1493500 [compost metagenome]